MIKLKVAEYCHDCPEFKADVNVDDFGYVTSSGYILNTSTIVKCEHAKRCQAIFEYFKKSYSITANPIQFGGDVALAYFDKKEKECQS